MKDVPPNPFRFQWFPLRIQRPWMKVVFVAGSFVLQIVHNQLPWASQTFNLVAATAFWVVVFRAFRSTDEEVDPPRAWWRATFGPTASTWLAVLTGMGFFGNLVPSAAEATSQSLGEKLATIGLCGVLFVYLTISAVMLYELRAKNRRNERGTARRVKW